MARRAPADHDSRPSGRFSFWGVTDNILAPGSTADDALESSGVAALSFLNIE